jgi:hypothetical protein
MATARVAEVHRLTFPHRSDADAFGAVLPSFTNRRVDRGLVVEVSATLVEQTPPPVSVRVDFACTAEVDTASDCAWRVQQLADAIEKAHDETTEYLRYGGARGVSEVVGRALAASRPEARIQVPLTEEDAAVLATDADAQRTVERAIYARTAFVADQAEQLTGLEGVRHPRHLTIVSPRSTATAVAIARAYLTAPRTPPSASVLPAPVPVWAWASAAIASLTFGLSWAPLTTATLCTLAAAVIAVAALAVWFAPRFRAKRSTTVWGVAPALLLVGFACVYAALIVAGSDRIAFEGDAPEHVRDPLLLSLSLLSTDGLLDSRVVGWVRSIAYLEMLLLAALAGGAGTVAVRNASRRLDQIVTEVRDQRENPRG